MPFYRRHIRIVSIFISGEKVKSPLGSINFLNEMENLLRSRFTVRNVEECIRPEGWFFKYIYYLKYNTILRCFIIVFIK